MTLRATQPALDSPAVVAGGKFVFASGSHPLDGYTIKRGIGHGGFGEVYYATSDAGKEVALKLVRRNLDVELRGVTQCLNLKHPNLLALYDIKHDGQENGWVVMEYVAGDCLHDVITKHPNGMPVADVLKWVHGILAAVAYLHDHGIVHRDLKPGNIFCDEGIVKVGDYGLSKFISCSRRSGQTGSVGTVHYMAPEVANGRYGKEIDIYAVGILLYEMLTGHVPFEGESIGEVLMKHLTAQPDLSALREPYRSAVDRALDKDPERRIRSAGELSVLLPGAPAGHVSAVPPPLPDSRQIPSRDIPPVRSPAAHAAPVALVAVNDEEPIWRLIRTTWLDLRHWWDHKDLSSPARFIILLGAFFVLLYTAKVWLPTLFAAGLLYAGYRIVRAVILSIQDGPSARPARTVAPPAAEVPPAPASPTLRRWREQPATMPLLVTTPREKLTELTGSLLSSAGVTAVTALVMLVLRGRTIQPNQFAWLTLTGAAGAWAVLSISKFWEGTRGEPALRRFVMMVVGLGLGVTAAAAMSGLLIDLRYEISWLPEPFAKHRLPAFYGADGTPLLPAFLAYWGFLFLVPRWWRQADPLRPARLSLWSTGVCLFWALVLNVFWPFPQPWGAMLAVIISVAVQLSAPWIPPYRRAGLRA